MELYKLIEKKIDFGDLDVVSLFGANDEYVTMIENRFKSGLIVRGNDNYDYNK